MNVSIVAVTPPEGSTIVKDTAVTIRVTASSGVLTAVWVAASYSGIYHTELVHDGTSFRAPFTNPTNTKTAITSGFEFILMRDGGWPGTPRVEILAVE